MLFLRKGDDQMLWTLIVGALIGAIAGAITGEKRGCLFNIVAGLVGSFIGQSLFSSWGPQLALSLIHI